MADAIRRRLQNTGTYRTLGREQKEYDRSERTNEKAFYASARVNALRNAKPVAAKKPSRYAPFGQYISTGKVTS